MVPESVCARRAAKSGQRPCAVSRPGHAGIVSPGIECPGETCRTGRAARQIFAGDRQSLGLAVARLLQRMPAATLVPAGRPAASRGPRLLVFEEDVDVPVRRHYTAVSGLTAQSNAFGNISDNVANSQTVGFKRVDTSFIDYLTTSTAAINDPGAVVARPDYVNTVQGTISQTDNPLGLAIAGQGFFAVSEQNGAVNGQPTFSAQQFYSRAGDFTMDKNGYLVNSAGNFLNGWSVDPTTGVVNRNALKPVQVSQAVFNPIATSQMTLSANLPATPSSSSPVSSQVQVYDALGNQHTVTLNWTQNAANDWTVSVNVPDDTTSAARGSAEVQFGSASPNAVPDGTIGNITTTTGSVTAPSYSASGPATLSFTSNFGSGAQTIQLISAPMVRRTG